MRVFLFGGSNCVVNGGVNSGWPAETEVVNAAIGASSSVQNLFALLKHKDAINPEDIVVTESNVNDSYNINVHGDINSESILRNIDSFYYELNRVCCKRVVILMPFRDYLGRQEAVSVVDSVNAQHRRNAKFYGFYLIDIHNAFLAIAEQDRRYLMADARHPLQAIMSDLSSRVARYFAQEPQSENVRVSNIIDRSSDELVHIRHDFSEMNTVRIKNKNMFNESVFILDKEFVFDSKYFELELIGIGTWCDGASQIQISTEDTTVVKNFNALNAFNEVISRVVINESTSVMSSFSDTKATEKSINCSNTKPTDFVGLTGFLLRKLNFSVDFESGDYGCLSLDFLIPSLKTYLSTIKFYLSRNEEYLDDIGLQVDRLILASETLRAVDEDQSLYLMQMAYNVRPSASIKRKLETYE